jgi:hypothetical protein
MKHGDAIAAGSAREDEIQNRRQEHGADARRVRERRVASWAGAILSASRSLKKTENVASSFDRLRMRPSVFSGLNLMVSLSNHGRIRFSASCVSNLEGASSATSPMAKVAPNPSSGQKPPAKSSKSSAARLCLPNGSAL